MKGKIILAAGFFTTIAVTGLMNPSGSNAAHTTGVDGMDRIGHGGSTYDDAHRMALGTDGCALMKQTGIRVDTIERIGHGGSTYFSSRLTSDQTVNCTGPQARVDVIERIGHGGSEYSSSETMAN
ncbi:MAG: hypothetical protein U0236_15645 [Nitrospira sp.]